MERFQHRRRFGGNAQQPLIWDDDESVDATLELCDALFCLPHPLLTFEDEGLRDHAHRQGADFARDPGDDRRTTRFPFRRPCRR